MLYIVGKDSQIREVLKPLSLPELGILERQHFEKWVCDYPDLLGEELFIVTTEYDRFDRTSERLDVLAIDHDGKLVIVELKREDRGGAPELQAIRYAAYCSNLTLADVCEAHTAYRRRHSEELTQEAAEDSIRSFVSSEDFEDFDSSPRIIVASGDFRDDTIASVLWLRSMGLDISCVRIEAFRIGEDIAVHPSLIVPLPEAEDFVIKAEHKKSGKELTPRQQEYLDFYTRLLDAFRERRPDVPVRKAPRWSWREVPSGFPGTHFEWAFHGRPRDSFEVGLHFERSDYDKNISVLRFLQDRADELQERIPEPLVFQEKWGKRWARVYIITMNGETDQANLQWGVERMDLFFDVFQPLLEEYSSSQ